MTPAPRTLPRRTVLAASGTAVLAAAAACSSATTTGPTTASVAGPAEASSAKPAATSTSAAATPAAADPTTATAEPAPAGTVIAAAADVQSAGSVVVDGPSGPVLLAWDNGTVVGHSAVCTHQGCTVGASGACPCHGSRFNVTTGAVENPPAQQPLRTTPVTVSGGQVYAT